MNLSSLLLRTLLPVPCIACGLDRAYGEPPFPSLCLKCGLSLKPLVFDQACSRCLMPFLLEGEFVSQPEECPTCVKSPPPFKRSQALWFYQDAVRQLILAAKYRAFPELLKQLFRFGLNHHSAPAPAPDTLVTWVPAEPLRRLKRGFHGPTLLAESLCRVHGLQRLGVLWRPPGSPPLKNLDRKKRRTLARRSFFAKPMFHHAVRGRKILLVDDLFTTGSTVSACSQVLLKMGATRVDVFCLAWDPLIR